MFVKLQRPPPEMRIFFPIFSALSSTATRRPRFPASIAHINPAAPAPNIIASNFRLIVEAIVSASRSAWSRFLLGDNLSYSLMSVMPAIVTRISRRFSEFKARGEMGIVAYITAGDPSLQAAVKFVQALAAGGVDVIELGVPFSDPLADGPTIQRASERALKAGTTLAGVIELVRKLRKANSPAAEIPVVLFSYYNPILQMRLEKFS